MIQHLSWAIDLAIFRTVVFEIPYILLFLCVDGDHRFTLGQEFCRCFVNKAELGIPVRMLLTNLIYFLILLFTIT